MLVASFTSSLTQLVGDYGLYAVFLLMLIDAVFPAGSEIVMLYGGAIASGAIAGADVTLFGYELRVRAPCLPRDRRCGNDRLPHRLRDRVGDRQTAAGGRSSNGAGRWFHLDHDEARAGRGVVPAVGGLGRAPRTPHARRALVRLDPRGRLRGAVPPLHRPHADRLGDLVLRLRRRRAGPRERAGRASTTRSGSRTSSSVRESWPSRRGSSGGSSQAAGGPGVSGRRDRRSPSWPRAAAARAGGARLGAAGEALARGRPSASGTRPRTGATCGTR